MCSKMQNSFRNLIVQVIAVGISVLHSSIVRLSYLLQLFRTLYHLAYRRSSP
jgi:hypothetical protein